MGVVYDAVHEALGRPVALKVIPRQLSSDREVTARFFREARAAASIGHPGIVEVFDLGQDDSGLTGGSGEAPPADAAGRGHDASPDAAPVVYLAMEKLAGEELADRLRRTGPMALRDALLVAAEAAEAIGAAHEVGIVHRDLKPQNVFLAKVGRREVVKVLDFGIAKLAQGDGADAPLTRTGQVFGTPMYMPPEQLRGVKDVDGRADIYALGVMLYECLSGRPPFQDTSYAALVVRISTEPPTPLGTLRPDLPAGVLRLVERSLDKNPERRPQNAFAFAEALRRLAEGGELDTVSALGAAPAAPEDHAEGAALLDPSRFTNDASAPTRPSAELGAEAARSAADTARPSGAPESAPASSPGRSVVLIGGGVLAAVVTALALVVSMGGPSPADDGDDGAAAAAADPDRDPSRDPEQGAASSGDPAAPGVGAGAPSAPAGSRPAAVLVPTGGTVPIDFPGPPGARYRVGDQSCIAPCSLELSGGDSHRVEASLEGHHARSTTVDPPLPAEVRLALPPRRPETSSGARGRGGRGAAPGDEPPPLLPR